MSPPVDVTAIDWRALLNDAIARDPRGIAGVAVTLGLSRAAVSLVVSDKYPASSARIARKVIDAFDRVLCPHLSRSLTHLDCRTFAYRTPPTSSPREMRHWRACQQCPHRPPEKSHA